MKLPNPDRAVVDQTKLAQYCLNPLHHRGRHKARKFRSLLGFTANDAPKLRQLLLKAALELEAQLGERDEFGLVDLIKYPYTWAKLQLWFGNWPALVIAAVVLVALVFLVVRLLSRRRQRAR